MAYVKRMLMLGAVALLFNMGCDDGNKNGNDHGTDSGGDTEDVGSDTEDVGSDTHELDTESDSDTEPGEWQAIEDLSILRGVWRQQGYARMFVFEDETVTDYHVTDVSCVAAEQFSYDDAKEMFDRIESNGQTFSWHETGHFTKQFFDQVDDLPAGCAAAGEVVDPEVNFDAFAALFEENYAYFDERQVNWEQSVETHRAEVTSKTTNEELFGVFQEMLTPFNDGHVYLWDGGELGFLSGALGDRWMDWSAQYQGEPVTNPIDPRRDFISDMVGYVENGVLKGEGKSGLDNTLYWGWLTETVGYLDIHEMTGGALSEMSLPEVVNAVDDAMADVMADLKDASGIVIDVRFNQGGMDTMGYAVAGWFAENDTLVARKRAVFGDGWTEEQNVYISARSDAYTGPVALLTGRNTISAAETFVQAMRELPNVTTVGENTYGSMSDVLLRMLPSGWIVALSNEVYESPRGDVFEVTGIPADIEVPINENRSFYGNLYQVLNTAVTNLGGAMDVGLEGIYQTEGYGWVYQIEGDSVSIFEISSTSCSQSIGGTIYPEFNSNGSAAAAIDLDIFGMLTIPMSMSPGDTEDSFYFLSDGLVVAPKAIRIDTLPEQCLEENRIGVDDLSIYDAVWQTFHDHYALFDDRDVDWDALKKTTRPRLTGDDPDSLFDVLVDLLSPLNDAHVSLSAGEMAFEGARPEADEITAEMVEAAQEIISESYIQESLGSGVLDQIETAMLDGNIGYIRTLGFGPMFTEEGRMDYAGGVSEINALLDTFFDGAAMSGLILDLRANTGGSDLYGTAVAQRLTDAAYTPYSIQARIDPNDPSVFSEPIPVTIEPIEPGYKGPVVVLVSRHTVSAGETCALALYGRDDVTFIGEPTQGAFSSVLNRFLPNGWMLGLPNEQYVTPDGNRYDVTGISPDVATSVFTLADIDAGVDSALDAAIALLM